MEMGWDYSSHIACFYFGRRSTARQYQDVSHDMVAWLSGVMGISVNADWSLGRGAIDMWSGRDRHGRYAPRLRAERVRSAGMNRISRGRRTVVCVPSTGSGTVYDAIPQSHSRLLVSKAA